MVRIPIPRLPLIPDPLRRIRVPDDLEPLTTIGDEHDPSDGGMTRDAVERVWRSIERLYRSGVHPAIQICLRREGATVLHRCIGHARGNGPGDKGGAPPELVTTETPFVIYSASKAITAVVAHMLDERHLIHLGDRVSEYIPEYAAHGKEAITIAHVLAHRAGVPNIPRDALDLDNIVDREFILKAICDARPRSRPGKALAYHAISGGFIIGEIVHRVTGKDIREFLTAEVRTPLGFRWTNYGVASGDVDRVGTDYATGAPPIPPISTLLERALGAGVDDVVNVGNDARFLTGVVPAGNVVSNADELSRFYELLRREGELDGVRILEPRTLRRALTEQSYREIDFTLGFPTRYSLGFMLGAELLSLYGPDTEEAFGHLGFTNIIGWADPVRALAGALITSGKPVFYPELPDLWGVMRGIGRAAPKVSATVG